MREEATKNGYNDTKVHQPSPVSNDVSVLGQKSQPNGADTLNQQGAHIRDDSETVNRELQESDLLSSGHYGGASQVDQVQPSVAAYLPSQNPVHQPLFVSPAFNTHDSHF